MGGAWGERPFLLQFHSSYQILPGGLLTVFRVGLPFCNTGSPMSDLLQKDFGLIRLSWRTSFS